MEVFRKVRWSLEKGWMEISSCIRISLNDREKSMNLPVISVDFSESAE
jgi:hypothetical protein